jgi:hypothetical protein
MKTKIFTYFIEIVYSNFLKIAKNGQDPGTFMRKQARAQSVKDNLQLTFWHFFIYCI